jgi:hypothetical protein
MNGILIATQKERENRENKMTKVSLTTSSELLFCATGRSSLSQREKIKRNQTRKKVQKTHLFDSKLDGWNRSALNSFGSGIILFLSSSLSQSRLFLHCCHFSAESSLLLFRQKVGKLGGWVGGLTGLSWGDRRRERERGERQKEREGKREIERDRQRKSKRE